MTSIRPAYSKWPEYNRALRDAVAGLSTGQLASQPSDERWPLWATIGHLACQRISALCGLAGEPGAEDTPFPNALYHCPGDEDLENVLSSEALVAAIDSTFAVVERCLDSWTWEMLSEEIRRAFDGEEFVSARGAILQRAFAHDIYHCAEINEQLGRLGLPQIDLWG